MIRHYDMASGEPLNDRETDNASPMQAPRVTIETRLEKIEANLTNPMARPGAMPADLALLDIAAFLRRQR